MKPQDYEELVGDVIAQLEDKRMDLIRNQKLKGKSGQSHQIDLVVDFERMGVVYRTLVECKYWNKRVGVESVMVLAKRKEDLGAQKGILVTTVGFQRGAFRIAKAEGIALIICRDKDDFLVETRRNLGASRTSSLESLIRNFLERKYSYYRQREPRSFEYTAFPLLLESEWDD